MKPKASAQWRSDRLRKDIQPASILAKKTELKRLSSKKKVTFDLSTKLSNSELALCDNKAVESLTPDAQKGRKLSSKSCVNIAAPRIASKPISKRPLACWFVQSGLCDQLSVRDTISLRKCFPSFAYLNTWEPIFNLKHSRPVKGILKNALPSDQFNKSCGSCPSHSHFLLASDSFHVSGKQKNNNHCQLSFPEGLDECSTFDNLASSIQKLHISALAPGYLGPT